jgi:hypothetical protein
MVGGVYGYSPGKLPPQSNPQLRVMHQMSSGQDSQQFEGSGATNLKQSQQLYHQQQNDSNLMQKLTGTITALQTELMIQTSQIQQLQEENFKLRHMPSLSIEAML